MPRSIALLFALGLLGLACSPSLAQVELEDTLHHDLVVQQATYAVTFEPDLSQATFGRVQACIDRVVPDVPSVSFTFDDDFGSARCANVFLNLTVPPGADRLTVNFTANRSVERVFDGTTTVGDAQGPMEQYYVVNGTGLIDRSIEMFDPTEGSSDAQVFAQTFLLEPPPPVVRVHWHFEDPSKSESPNQALPIPDVPANPDQPFATGQTLDANVSKLTFSWTRVPLVVDPVIVEPEQINEAGTHGSVKSTMPVIVPDIVLAPVDAFDPNAALRKTSTATVRIEVASGPTFQAVVGPKGAIGSEGYTVIETGQRDIIEIPDSTLVQQGPGLYLVEYESVRVLPPPAAPETPTRIYPFYFILAFLPMVAAVLALHQTTVYVRQAEGPYRRTAWPITAAVGLVVLYYLVLLGYSLFGIGPRVMSSLPLVREAVLVYIQLVLLLIMLSAAALAVSRTLMTSMRRDIEERERKEDQLRRSNEELERFAYVASHDLQEPLRKVAGFTALLQKKYAGRLDKDADEIIGYAVDGATRMQMLIKDILAYSRVGSRELQRVQVDADAVMELVTADLGEPIKETKARIRWGGLPTVRADASQLRQILQNLVENAIKYHKPGRRPMIEVSGRSDGESWHFEVKDNGIGIPADKHEEIFGIFRRLHGQDTRGTGIGLAVAKKAVERHGGKIWVESKPGHGSTFHFTLPRSAFDTAGSPLPQRTRRRAAAAG